MAGFVVVVYGKIPERAQMYLKLDNDAVCGYDAVDRRQAQVFPTETAAQAAIDSIPQAYRQGGMSVQPAD